jgi:hypothetical protein
MTPGEFASKLKASTEANIDFVKLETYLTDENVRIRMHEPAIKDNNVLGYEYEEVRRLVDQFMPGEDIYVSIDKYGEIFYRVADGIIKGKTNNGKREVEFIQVPSRYKSNEKTETNEDNQIKEANADQQNVKNPEEKSMGDMNVSVRFEINKFYNLFDARDAIMHGDDPDVQNQLISQISALFDLCFKQQVDNNLIQCINTFYNENKDEYEHVKNSGTMINGKRMNLQEYKLLEKLDNAYKSALSQKTEEQVDEEINEFGIEGTTVEEGRNNIVDFDRSVEKRDVKVRKRTLPKANAAFTMITIILEILTVAIIIMMFLSLDI